MPTSPSPSDWRVRLSTRLGTLLPHMGVLVASLLALAAWGPLLPSLAEGYIGVEYVDGFGTQWFYWFVERGVRSLEPMGHTDLFFYPWGKDIFAHTGTNILDAVFAVPFRMLLGEVLGYNAVSYTHLTLPTICSV